MSAHDAHDPHDDIQGADDRVLASMLREAVGRSGPPDLSAAVVVRLQHERAEPRRRGLPLALGALLGAAAALLAWVQFPPPVAPGPDPAVSLRVADGCLRWTRGATVREATAPVTVAWPIQPRDRLAVCSPRGATTDLADLGRLHMTATTELEVQKMEWKPFVTGAALGAVTVAVIHGAITWTSGGDVARAAQGDSLELRAPAGSGLSMASMEEKVASLEKELQRERQRYASLEAEVSRQRVAGAEAADGNAAGAAANTIAPEDRLRAGVSYGGFEAALAAVDWDATGDAMFKMTSKLAAMMEAIEKGGDLPLDVVAEIQQLNGELIKQAKALLDAKVPGTGVNGAFTHPVMAANQIFAALQKGGMPLTSVQRDSLQRLSAQLAGEDDIRRSKVGSDELGLAEVVGEMEIKDRFYAEARRLLTPQQEQALFHAATEDSTSNIFGSGIAWAQFGKALPSADRADYASQVSDSLTRQIGLGADLAPQVQAMVAQWAKQIPDAAFAGSGREGPLAQITQKTSAIRDAAQRQVALLREMMRTLPLSAEQKAKLRKAYAVYVPYGKAR